VKSHTNPGSRIAVQLSASGRQDAPSMTRESREIDARLMPAEVVPIAPLKPKGPLQRAFRRLAGAGFERATSGL
jgi:hypothetical protein